MPSTSDGAFVWVWLPGADAPVVAGRVLSSKGRPRAPVRQDVLRHLG